MSDSKLEALGPAMGMVVHDLRNPAATLRANLSFVREVAEDPSVPPSELVEAIDDAQLALFDLLRGLDQLGWLGRHLAEQPAGMSQHEDVREALSRTVTRLQDKRLQLSVPETVVMGRGGECLSRLVELLAVNALAHGVHKPIELRLRESDDRILVEVADQGRALAEEFRETGFTLEGQPLLKSRGDGRYSRVLGLFCAKLLADALGATLEAAGSDGEAVFRVTLPKD